MSDELVRSLKKVLLFSDLPDDLLSNLAAEVEAQTMSQGSFLFHEGEAGDALFVILSGELEVFRGELDDPQRQVLAKLGEGEYIGEMALLENKPRSASVRALTDCSLLHLKRQDFNALLEKNPKMAVKLTAAISARLRSVMEGATSSPKAVRKSVDLGRTRVFISYSRRDKIFVKALHEAISQEGINTWVDWENIPLTADWWDEIVRGIKNSDAFAYVISPDSLTSSVCQRELATAVENNKRLVPVLYREAPKDLEVPLKIPQVISDSNWVWMRSEAEMRANLGAMLAVINTDLEWVREHTRLLGRALDWDAAGRNNNLLLRGPDLVSAQAWLAKASAVTEPKPLPVHGDYIEASRKDAAFRQRITRGVGVAFIALMLVATIVSGVGFSRATKNQYEAQTAQSDAAFSLVKANLANTQVAKSLDEAQAAKVRADESFAIARSEANKALARNLASQALLKNNVDHSLALLLGVEAFIKDPSSQARSALFEILQFIPFTPLFGHPYPVTSVAVSDNDIIASASCIEIAASQCVKGEIILWDAKSRKPISAPIITDTVGQINSLAFSPDGKILVSGGCIAYNKSNRSGGCQAQEGQITLWDIALDTGPGAIRGTANLRSSLQGGHTGPVTSVAFSPVGPYLASGSFDKSVILWDVDEERLVAYLSGQDGHTSFVNSVAFSPDGSLLASGGDDRQIILWDVGTFKVVHKLINEHKGAISSVTFSHDGKWLASASYDKTILLWNLENFSVSAPPLRGHTGYVTSVAFNKDDTELASGSFDQSVIIWSVANHLPVELPLNKHTRPVNAISFTPDGELVSASNDRTIVIWALNSRPAQSLSRPITGLETSLQNLSLSSDEATILAEGSGQGVGKVYGWDFSTGLSATVQDQILGERDCESAVSTSGLQASVSQEDNNSIILSRADRPLVGHTGPVNCIAFSPDGLYLASASVDQTIILWDADPASPTFKSIVQTLTGHTSSVTELLFKDKNTLISTGDDQEIIIWYIDVNDWQRLACNAAQRQLTAEEKNQYFGNENSKSACEEIR